MAISKTLAAAAIALACVGPLTACGSGTNTSATSETKGTGTLDGDGKTIVVFMPSTSNVYLAGWLKGAEAEAEKRGYKIKDYQNNFDQAEQDQQVQQFISSGEKPAAIIWWPSNVEASINDTRQLSRVAPIIQANQQVPEGGWEYVTAYAGVDDSTVATTAGEEALKARAALEAAGKAFDQGGHLLEFGFPAGYRAGELRHEAFLDATKSEPFDVLRYENTTGNLDAQAGFESASQVVPKYKAEDIDFVYAHNLDIAAGVAKALEQNGLTPGKDVTIIAANCSGNLEPLQNGTVHSSVIQPPIIEGALAVRSAAQYLATGKVTDNEVVVEATAEEPELKNEPPAKSTYLMAEPLLADNLDQLTIWGLSGTTLCSG